MATYGREHLVRWLKEAAKRGKDGKRSRGPYDWLMKGDQRQRWLGSVSGPSTYGGFGGETEDKEVEVFGR